MILGTIISGLWFDPKGNDVTRSGEHLVVCSALVVCCGWCAVIYVLSWWFSTGGVLWGTCAVMCSIGGSVQEVFFEGHVLRCTQLMSQYWGCFLRYICWDVLNWWLSTGSVLWETCAVITRCHVRSLEQEGRQLLPWRHLVPFRFPVCNLKAARSLGGFTAFPCLEILISRRVVSGASVCRPPQVASCDSRWS